VTVDDEKNLNGVNNKLEEILEILRRQDGVLEEHGRELKEIKERISDLEKDQKALALDQDAIRSFHHEINVKMGQLDQRCDERCVLVQTALRRKEEGSG
jgi:DNA repair ATPase RecN